MLCDVYKIDQSLHEVIIDAASTSYESPAKRIKIEGICPSPSSLGNLTGDQYNRMKMNLCLHRPNHGLHVSLQVETFGKFIDELKKEKIPEPKYMEGAIEVMKVSASEESEGKKKEKFEVTLRNLFNGYAVSSKYWGPSSQSQSNISVYLSDDVLVNFEIKQEISAGGSEPVIENVGYYIKFQSRKRGERAPMFLVTMVGPYYMQVFGAVWDGGNLCMDPLSDPLSLLYVPCDPFNAVVKLARVFRTLSTLACELTQTEGCKGSYFSHNSLKNVKLMYPYIRVFNATWNDRPAVLKFTSSYGLDVHNYLHVKQLAPEVLHYQRLPGNWYVVIMEKVGDPLPDELTSDIKASLTSILTLLMDKKYVHGDLRRPNIRVVGDTVRVLDFDWAGKEGEARYPPDLNKKCAEWHLEVKGGGVIKSDHDRHLITHLQQKVQH